MPSAGNNGAPAICACASASRIRATAAPISSFACCACAIKSLSCGEPNPRHHSAEGHAATAFAVATGGPGGDAEEGLAGGPARVVAIASVAAAVAADSSAVRVVLTFQAAGAGMSGRLYRGP